MRTCSFCGEEVQDAALKCKHCKEWLSMEPTQQSKKAPLIAQAAKSGWAGKTVKVVSTVGAILLFIIFMGIAKVGGRSLGRSLVSPNSISVKDSIAQTATKLNEGLPMMVDKETRLNSVGAVDNKFIYYYTLINFSSNEIDAAEVNRTLSSRIRSGMCSNPATRKYLDMDILYDYTYYGNDNGFVAKVTLAKKDCNEQALAPSQAKGDIFDQILPKGVEYLGPLDSEVRSAPATQTSQSRIPWEDYQPVPAPAPVPQTSQSRIPWEDYQQEATSQFLNKFARLVPDWQSIRDDPKFLIWLRQADTNSNKTRYDQLSEAQASNNAELAARFYIRYKNGVRTNILKEGVKKSQAGGTSNKLREESTPKMQRWTDEKGNVHYSGATGEGQ